MQPRILDGRSATRKYLGADLFGGQVVNGDFVLSRIIGS
jgi:hypothetical protein